MNQCHGLRITFPKGNNSRNGRKYIMLVYVLNKDGKPLMPCHPAVARILLKENNAEVASHSPFTIRLLYASSEYTQPVTLGIGPGSKMVGLSATTEKKELFAAEIELSTTVV